MYFPSLLWIFPSLLKWWGGADINKQQSLGCVSLGDGGAPSPQGWGMEHGCGTRGWGLGALLVSVGERGRESGSWRNSKGRQMSLWGVKEREAMQKYWKEKNEMELDAKTNFKQAERKQEGSWTTDPMEINLIFNGVISASTGQSTGMYLLFQHTVKCGPIRDTGHGHCPRADALSFCWKTAHDTTMATVTSSLTMHYISKTLHPDLVQIFLFYCLFFSIIPLLAIS